MEVELSGTEENWGVLLAAAQAGDAEAYRQFLHAILPFLRSVARARTRGDELAEDVVQDALLTLHRVRHTYEPGRPVKPWLAAIAARRAIDAMRRRGRQTSREVHDPGAYETFAGEQANAGEAGEAKEELARRMGELTPKQKEALELVKLKEMSLVEASAESGQSVASLKVNIHRAMKKLRLGQSRDEGG
ncbi:MAG TPA: sigma-70 family RNA polymerase sigma factor [Allosphingosinicella sp.]|nr:sigma-70 family RNA polymerase sigma factor [Allosphingosinicella sp.]